VRLLVVTDSGSGVAPSGTFTVSVLVVAEVTVAFTPPKYTVLLPGEELKFEPWIVTDAPTGAAAGENE